MEHLDDFIREQFEMDDPASRFPFREEYWKQALPLIEAAERRRRRGLLWWWFAGLLVLGGGWWGWRQSDLDQPIGLQQPPGIGYGPNATLPANEAAPTLGAATVPSIGVPVVAYENGENQNFDVGKNTASKQRPWVAKTPVIPLLQKGPVGEATANGQMCGTAKRPTTASPDPVMSLSVVTAATAMNDRPASTAEGQKAAADTVESATPVPFAKRAAPQNIPRLPTAFQTLSYGSAGFALDQVPYVFPRIKPVHEPIFALGLTASATVYRPALAGRLWGATMGGYAEYWLRANWSIAAGLGWRNQPVDAGTPDTLSTSYQLHYRFGYEEVTYLRADRSLHFLEMPLSLRWRYRVCQLEAGAALVRLVGVRAVLIQTSRSSLLPTPEVTEKRSWGQLTGYRRSYTALFAGIGWQPLRRLQLEIRGTYRPASLLLPNGENPSPSGGFWLDAGLRWQLFSDERIRVKR